MHVLHSLSVNIREIDILRFLVMFSTFLVVLALLFVVLIILIVMLSFLLVVLLLMITVHSFSFLIVKTMMSQLATMTVKMVLHVFIPFRLTFRFLMVMTFPWFVVIGFMLRLWSLSIRIVSMRFVVRNPVASAINISDISKRISVGSRSHLHVIRRRPNGNSIACAQEHQS